MSSLKAIYQSFLANPTAAALSLNASLNYITTLTTINSPAAIVKHFAAHQRVLQKKQEMVLSAIENEDAVCLDVETTLEFLTGGGAYLPGLDDNFLADHIVTFPMIHIVHFDSNQKIQTIRLYWDQGSLLKMVDVIGARARNWPIRDGKDQARLIASSGAPNTQDNASVRTMKNNEHDQNGGRNTKKLSGSSKNVTGDPHASLSLFAPRDTNQESPHQPAAVAPRASAKPPPRDYHDLFAGNDSDASPVSKARPLSPLKENRGQKAQSSKPPPRDYHDLFVGNESDASPVITAKQQSPQKEMKSTSGAIAPKGGSGKNFQPFRLFETENSQPGTPGTPAEPKSKFIKPDPARYNHFELGPGMDEVKNGHGLPSRPTTKHQSQWQFEDFMTPEKVPQKIRGQDARHFGWSDDEPNMDSPAKHLKVAQPRPDARTHFEFQDDGTPAGDQRPPGHPRGPGGNNGLGLYKNDIFDAVERSPSPEKKNHPLSTMTNLKDRHKDLDPHFTMTDDLPAEAGSNGAQKPVHEGRTKAVKMMNAQWEAMDQSPEQTSKKPDFPGPDARRPASEGKENYGSAKDRYVGVKNGGDGMGGKKGAGRSWGFGDDSDEDGEGGINGGKFQAGKKQQAPQDNKFWDY